MWIRRLLLTLQGSALMVSDWCKRDCTSLSLRLILVVPDKGDTCAMHSFKLHFLSVYIVHVQKEKVKSQDRSHSQKEIRRELQSIPKTIYTPSGQGPSGQTSLQMAGEPCTVLIPQERN